MNILCANVGILCVCVAFSLVFLRICGWILFAQTHTHDTQIGIWNKISRNNMLHDISIRWYAFTFIYFVHTVDLMGHRIGTIKYIFFRYLDARWWWCIDVWPIYVFMCTHMPLSIFSYSSIGQYKYLFVVKEKFNFVA